MKKHHRLSLTWDQKIGQTFTLLSAEDSVWIQLHTNRGIYRWELEHNLSSLEYRLLKHTFTKHHKSPANKKIKHSSISFAFRGRTSKIQSIFLSWILWWFLQPDSIAKILMVKFWNIPKVNSWCKSMSG